MQPFKAKLETILKYYTAVLLYGQWYKMFVEGSGDRTLNSFQASSTTFYVFFVYIGYDINMQTFWEQFVKGDFFFYFIF